MDTDWHNSMYQMTESVYTMYALFSKVGYDNHFLGHNEAVLWYACTEDDSGDRSRRTPETIKLGFKMRRNDIWYHIINLYSLFI